MTWLFGIGGKLAAVGGAILAGLLIVWRILAQQKQAGVDQQKVKDAAAREKARDDNLKRIQAAQDAGRTVRPDDPDIVSDPFNRDNRR